MPAVVVGVGEPSMLAFVMVNVAPLDALLIVYVPSYPAGGTPPVLEMMTVWPSVKPCVTAVVIVATSRAAPEPVVGCVICAMPMFATMPALLAVTALPLTVYVNVLASSLVIGNEPLNRGSDEPVMVTVLPVLKPCPAAVTRAVFAVPVIGMLVV